MTADLLVRAKSISKEYRLKNRQSNKKVLDNVSFELKRGEVLGVLGRNGAGKSTLLKILCGAIKQTSGEYEINGRLRSVLELGTGFQDAYTGRENILMGGLCLGMSKKEVMLKQEEIIEFSGLRENIDEVFGTYSSGMKGRLTFSTAMCDSPDVFIIDEALATGDAIFQERCLKRVKEICNSGAAVILVTHSISMLYDFCTSAIMLESGKIFAEGDVKAVGKEYEKYLGLHKKNEELSSEELNLGETGVRSLPNRFMQVLEKGNGVDLLFYEFADAEGSSVTTLESGNFYTLSMVFRFHREISKPNFGFRFQKSTGVIVFGDTSLEKGYGEAMLAGEVIKTSFKFKCRYEAGSYLMRMGVTSVQDEGFETLFFSEEAVEVVVINSVPLNGLVDCESLIAIEKIESS